MIKLSFQQSHHDSNKKSYDSRWLQKIFKDLQFLQRFRTIKLDLNPLNHPNFPRYEITIFDAHEEIKKKQKDLTCAVLIIPQGREHESLFNSLTGYTQLARQIQTSRLILISLCRYYYQEFTKMCINDVQKELNEYVSLLIRLQNLRKGYKVPYLSVDTNESLGKRVIINKTDSKISGEIVVEDIYNSDDDNNQTIIRRMIFSRRSNLIQSEVLVKNNDINILHLCSSYQRLFFMCLSYWTTIPYSNNIDKKDIDKINITNNTYQIDNINDTNSNCLFSNTNNNASFSFSILHIGAGSGSLTLFFSLLFPNSRIDLIEIDPSVIDVSLKFFGFECCEYVSNDSDFKKNVVLNEKSNIRVKIKDGLEYIHNNSHTTKYDIIIVDVDSKEILDGLTAPPKDFLTKDTLSSFANYLTSTGILLLNFACRDEKIHEFYILQFKQIFQQVVIIAESEDVNQVILLQGHKNDNDFSVLSFDRYSIENRLQWLYNAVLQKAQQTTHKEFIWDDWTKLSEIVIDSGVRFKKSQKRKLRKQKK